MTWAKVSEWVGEGVGRRERKAGSFETLPSPSPLTCKCQG